MPIKSKQTNFLLNSLKHKETNDFMYFCEVKRNSL
jgi:hypothetical protein